MEQHSDWLNGFQHPITVCDAEGKVLFMNRAAGTWYERFGGTACIGSNLLDCHPEPARSVVASMLRTPTARTYSIERAGRQYLVCHSTWYKDGEQAGLVELILEVSPAERSDRGQRSCAMNNTTAIVTLLLASTALLAMGQRPDPAAWTDYKPNLPRDAVRRVNDRWPLSDQQNVGRWEPYRPMWDEFNGRRLDERKWWDHNPTWKGRQPAAFLPSNVEVRDGRLHLTMRAEEPPEPLRKDGYHTFTSAAVQSKERVLYGYFEVRAKAMRSHGSSAFWFYYSEPERWTEIDVFEIGGGAPGFERKLFMTVHVFHTPTERQHWQIGGVYEAPFDLAADFHVYGLQWDEKEIQFYLDGVLVRRGPNTHWHQPLTLNFDTETMPDWFGLPKAEELPSTYSIDYVRAWKRRP